MSKLAAERIAGLYDGRALPLDFLISVYRDPEVDLEVRVNAAKAAAPFVHRRRPQEVEVSTPQPLAISFVYPLG